jgi:hypothetical protein
MVTIAELWAPILLSAVLVFFASFLIWTVLPIHRKDYRPLPDEASAADVLRRQNLEPGQYIIPSPADPKDRKDPEFLKRMEQGPVAFFTVVRPGAPRMGKNLAQWSVYLLVISYFVAYLTSRTVAPGAEYGQVFRVAGTTAILAYSAALVQTGIWWARPWSNVWKDVLDGVIYGLLTAGAFAWLWPR